MMTYDEIYHFGIPRKSGRYRWGSGKRPFQSLEKSTGKTEAIKNESEEEKKKRYEAEKERLIRTGSAKDVFNYQKRGGYLNNDELRTIADRMKIESDIRRYSKKEIQKGIEEIDKVMSDIKKLNNWTKIATDSWNSFASIYNSTSSGRTNPLTLIRTTQQQRPPQPSNQ